MAVVMEPELSEEKLRSLLAEKHEQRVLDYKQTYDLNNKTQLLKLTKCIAAMQSEPEGGYIVIGANDHGEVVPAVTAEHAELYDEAKLRAKITTYIAEPFDLQTFQCSLDGHTVILIYVPPNPHGWTVFKADGNYIDASGKPQCMFRIGEVFVRRGTASERWMTADQQRLIEQIVARRKEAWLAEMRKLLAKDQAITETVQQLQHLPTVALTWRMDGEGFEELVIELIRRGDDIPVRHLLGKAQADAVGLFGQEAEELSRLLDRVTSIGAIGLYYDRNEWFGQAIDVLSAIYSIGFSSAARQRGGRDIELLWLETVSRVYGLGALAVRLKKWTEVRELAICRPEGEWSDHFGSWLRHALTMASRANLFEEEQAGLIARAHNVVRRVQALHADRSADSDVVLTSLCQFDVYGTLAVIAVRGSVSSGNFYPSFAPYESRRVEPAFVGVVADPTVRSAVFPADDTLLATAIREMSRIAQQEAFAFGGWDGISDGRVRAFLEEHTQ